MSDSVRPHRQQPAPLSLGFSRQEYWSGLPFPSLMHESESEREVAQSCPTLSSPMDCSLPGSSVHGFSRQEYWSGVPLPSPNMLSRLVVTFLPRSKRLLISCLQWPSIPLLEINLEKNVIEKDTCTPVFIAAWFPTFRTWKWQMNG